MRVQHAAQVAHMHKRGQCTVYGGFDLPGIFAQFGFDIGHAERGIDIGLIFAGYQFQVRLFTTEEAIIVDGHIHAERAPPQWNMVLFGACEMVQRIWKLAIIDDAQVHIDAAFQHHARFCFTFAGNSLDSGLAGEYVHDLAPGGITEIISDTRYDINVANCFAAAAQAARDLQAHDLRDSSQYFSYPLSLFLGYRVQETATMLRQESKTLQYLILRLFAKTGQRGYFVLFAGLLQFLNAIDMQLIVHRIDFFRPHTGNAAHLQLDLRRSGDQFIMERHLPAIDQLFDALDNGCAQARYAFELAF